MELTKSAALAICVVALCVVFEAAFLVPDGAGQTVWDTLTLLTLAGGMCVASGALFCEREGNGLLRTLPMQIFIWSAGLMGVLWVMAWYLETHCVWYRDVRRL